MKKKHGKSKRWLLVTGFVLLFVVSLFLSTLFWLYERAAKPLLESLGAIKISSDEVPSPTLVTSEDLEMPKTDVVGEDLAIAPRLNGAIRSKFSSSENGNFTAVEYIIELDFKAVEDQYEQILKNNGGRQLSRNNQTMVFQFDNGKLTLQKVLSDPEGTTKFSLNFSRIN